MLVFPFLRPAHSLVLLRMTVAGLLMAHAAVRVLNGSIQQFAGFLQHKGLPYGTVLVGLITAVELLGGLLLLLGVFTRWVALVFFLLISAGIVLIHAENGWFVGEHGTGGMEYSVLLLVCLLVLAASQPVSAPGFGSKAG
ncbi:DoxX family protein [Hymenobacter chitinivorans]|uniref:Putative oxidoreductase n=1 Tax=Hymenobacter chitinivorans DSM 11115 TaxID=1121954 RepID=A0A2M9BM96_9BACT|nr:DoxX family membrane protein [Hymenobacter chitinivorans]PJJ59063.1 putative oxidoreductase [Hymenobacter chitinivorans DSM 11115]